MIHPDAYLFVYSRANFSIYLLFWATSGSGHYLATPITSESHSAAAPAWKFLLQVSKVCS